MSQHFFKLFTELLTNSKKINKIEEVRKVEGSGFGCLPFGFNDGIITFL